MGKVDFSGNYLNAETCKEGDICIILGPHTETEKDFSGKKVKQVDIPCENSGNGKKLTYSPNQANGKKLQKAFGDDSDQWPGQKFITHIYNTKVNGVLKQMVDIEPIVAVKA